MKGTKEDSIGATPEATAMNLLEKFESSPEGRTEEGTGERNKEGSAAGHTAAH